MLLFHYEHSTLKSNIMTVIVMFSENMFVIILHSYLLLIFLRLLVTYSLTMNGLLRMVPLVGTIPKLTPHLHTNTVIPNGFTFEYYYSLILIFHTRCLYNNLILLYFIYY